MGFHIAAPRKLAPPLRCLPPILHRPSLTPAQSCSKGARGLSVPPRVTGIFTDTSISPSSWLRQCPDRYAIRAGRNLPDKEFRYLRTVIVTAAVYWGFDSRLAPLSLTFQHRAGVTPYTSTFVFAECCVFNKQSPPPGLCPPHLACAKTGPSSPEVTRAICLVPSAYFSQAPWYSLPVHLCRFRVRSCGEAISWNRRPCRVNPIRPDADVRSVTHPLAHECSHGSHRLRLSASA